MSHWITGHVDAKGFCWEARTDSRAVAERVDAVASEHGYDLKHGPCHGRELRHHQMDGWTLSQHEKGEAEITDLTIYGHVFWKGHCW